MVIQLKVKRGLLITVLLTVFFSSSVFCQSANAKETTGFLGEYICFTILAPEETRMAENTVVDMTFTSIYDFIDIEPRNYFISIESLTMEFWLNGANITSLKAWQKSNIKLKSWESIRDNVTLKPSKEGLITGRLSASYNYTYEGSSTVGHSWGFFNFPIANVRTATYNELWNSRNLLYGLMFVLVLTTITFIATTIYFARRKPNLKKGFVP